jgi:cytochrome c oxidase assembly protein Cox11
LFLSHPSSHLAASVVVCAARAGVSTYNVSPQRAGLYFNKIQCFCFEARAPRGCT